MDGVLEFDGNNWLLIEITGGAFALGLDEEGRVCVAGQGELGYLEPYGNGGMRFRSLLGQPPSAYRSFADNLVIFAIIVIFEYMFYVIEPSIGYYSNGIAFFQVLVVAILAFILLPADRMVMGFIRRINAGHKARTAEDSKKKSGGG